MDMADLVSSVPGHDDPSEPPPTSYPAGGTFIDSYSYTTQYQPGMMLVPGPGAASNCGPIVWDMGMNSGMMAMPMEMHDKSMSWAPWPPVEAWSTENGMSTAQAGANKDQPPAQVSEPSNRFREVSTCSVATQCDMGIQCDLTGCQPSTQKSEVAVQCDAPSQSLWSPRSVTHACKHCGCVPPAAATPLSSDSTQCEDEQQVAWGPANDWAWDQCTVDTDGKTRDSPRLHFNKLERERLHRLLPPAPSMPPQLPPRKFLPPAPSMPPPLPPRKGGRSSDRKAKQSEQSYPSTPTTVVSSSADSAAATSPSAHDSTGSEHGIEVPDVEVMPSGQDCLVEKLQRKLEVLNADQQVKAESSAPTEQNSTQAAELSKFSNADAAGPSARSSSTPATQQKSNTAATAKKAVAAAPVAPVQSRLQRRQCKGKDARAIAATGSHSLQSSPGDAGANLKAQPSKKSSAAKGRPASQKDVGSIASVVWWACVAVGILALFAVLGHTLRHALGTAWAQASQKEAMVQLPIAGTSHAWAAARPEDAPSQVRERTVSAVVRAHHAEVARGQAVAQQVQAKVKQVKLHRQLQQYQEEREKHELKRQTADYMYWQQLQMIQRQKMQAGALSGQKNDEQHIQQQRTDASRQLKQLAKQKSRQLGVQQKFQAFQQQKPLSTFQLLRAQAERRLAEASRMAQDSQ